ncbi:MAG TPA: ferritin family protein, partial [Burkholderiaceae bacterium]
AMETEAADRYAECADVLEAHNNLEVAVLFRSLARIERMHGEQLVRSMGRTVAEAPRRTGATAEQEGAAPADLHYLMRPHHALTLALRGEQEAQRFYARLARTAASDEVRKVARDMARDEAEHVRLIEEWLKRTPVPAADWAADDDPPRLGD